MVAGRVRLYTPAKTEKYEARVAIEAEETFRFRLKAAELHVEIWRSKEASNRAEGRATQ